MSNDTLWLIGIMIFAILFIVFGIVATICNNSYLDSIGNKPKRNSNES